MKYILQKIILIFVLIFIVLVFFKTCSAKSEIKQIQHIIGPNWFIVASVVDWEIYYHHKNYQWSTELITDEIWNEVKKFEYDLYGRPIYPPYPSLSPRGRKEQKCDRTF